MKPIGTSATTAPLVLYVEDETPNWEVTELRLRGRYRLLWAKNAREACAVIREHATSLHAILMDVQLANSELDGIELTKLLRHKELTSPAPDYAAGLPLVPCPIFFVTAYGHLLAGSLVGDAGANGLVAKPVDFVKLSNLLARSHAMQALAALSV